MFAGELGHSVEGLPKQPAFQLLTLYAHSDAGVFACCFVLLFFFSISFQCVIFLQLVIIALIGGNWAGIKTFFSRSTSTCVAHCQTEAKLDSLDS